MFIRIARSFIPYLKVWAFWLSYVRGDIITKELIDYFGQIKENTSLRHYQLPSNKLTVKPKDLIDRINDTIKFNSVILVKKY